MRRRADITITAHVVQRWQQRVDPDATWLGAHLAIRRFLKGSRVRPTPRHWMRRPTAPGTTYAFTAGSPGVCVIIKDGTAVTVITRRLVRAAPRLREVRSGRRLSLAEQEIPTWIDDDLVA